MAKLRTFVAIEIPDDVRRQTSQLMDTMRQETDSVRWVPTENLHVTLKFLGDVEDREIYSICRAVNNSVSNTLPFSVPCVGVNAFPAVDRPKTIWLGIDDLNQELTNLFARLDAELSDIGFPREPRRFVPHITLGRIQHGRRNLGNLPIVMKTLGGFDAGWLPVDSLTIFTSELTRSGPSYTVVGRSPLDG